MRLLIIGAGMVVPNNFIGLMFLRMIEAPVPPPRPIDIASFISFPKVAKKQTYHRKQNQPFYRGLKKYSKKVK